MSANIHTGHHVVPPRNTCRAYSPPNAPSEDVTLFCVRSQHALTTRILSTFFSPLYGTAHFAEKRYSKTQKAHYTHFEAQSEPTNKSTQPGLSIS